VSTPLDALRWSAWLGWRVDSNWTTPWLFIFFVLIKPLAGSMLLVGMYWAAQSATGGRAAAGFLPFAYVSSACFLVVAGVTSGMSQAVITDRENYGMLKFIRISPAPFRACLIGRGLSRAAQALLGAVLTVAVGWLLFDDVRDAMDQSIADLAWLALFLLLGAVMQIALGLLLASAVLNMSRYGNFLSEGVTGVLFLVSGAAFPIDLLPPALQQLSLVLPTTYWLEGMRRALIGGGAMDSQLTAWPTAAVALVLAAGTAVLCVAAHAFFRWSEHRAWRLGRYDLNSGN
jgi:ABC-2 type transport system permease protein